MHVVVNTWYHNGLQHITAMHGDSLYLQQHIHEPMVPIPVQVQVTGPIFKTKEGQQKRSKG